MNPALTRHIRVARHRLYGTPLDESAQEDERLATALMEFKTFLTRRIDLEVRIELYVDTSWQSNLDGCSLQFKVDHQLFLLAQRADHCELFLRSQGNDVLLAKLSDNEQFQDRLLVAIDDALK
ncbi:MAG TPA: hypothetical protein VN833_32890 [Candidatus Acidoferrales bacterium]|nr:hypothetical protein [Candidatus Acidoferrales bacterium]